jgi:hypothetical protein
MTTETNALEELESDADAAPYERSHGEPALHFEWFHAYLMLGPGRSVLGAYNRFQGQKAAKSGKKRPDSAKISQLWRETARRWRWRERAAVWDAEQREKREFEIDAEMREVYGALLMRGRAMLKTFDQMSAFPLVETESTTIDKTGHKTIVLKPTRWTMDTAARMAVAAAGLFKAAFELEEGRVRSEVDGESTEDAIEGAIETLKTLGYIVVAPGQEIPDGDDDDD